MKEESPNYLINLIPKCNQTIRIRNSHMPIFHCRTDCSRLRLGFSHLNEHRFRHNFENCINPLCSCSFVTEDTLHYLLHCHHFSQYLFDLVNSVKSVVDNFESLSGNDKKDILLYGDWRLDDNKNIFILEATLNYFKKFWMILWIFVWIKILFFYFLYWVFHPKRNYHISLIFHAYNVLLSFLRYLSIYILIF